MSDSLCLNSRYYAGDSIGSSGDRMIRSTVRLSRQVVGQCRDLCVNSRGTVAWRGSDKRLHSNHSKRRRQTLEKRHF